jgi:cytochrome c553
MRQEAGEKGAVAVGLQPTIPKSGRLLVAALALLSACGDAGKEPAAPPETPTAVAPPTAAETTAMSDAVTASVGDDAYTLYKRACVACHGETGDGVGDFPSLAKLSGKDIESRLHAYRAGETVGPKSALMAPIAKPLSDEQIAALALYLGS